MLLHIFLAADFLSIVWLLFSPQAHVRHCLRIINSIVVIKIPFIVAISVYIHTIIYIHFLLLNTFTTIYCFYILTIIIIITAKFAIRNIL